jgi:hypothetical protein
MIKLESGHATHTLTLPLNSHSNTEINTKFKPKRPAIHGIKYTKDASKKVPRRDTDVILLGKLDSSSSSIMERSYYSLARHERAATALFN